MNKNQSDFESWGILECPNDYGCYSKKVYLEFPDFMLWENGGYYKTKNGCIVDFCIANEITELWNKGITTYNSCCGHGKSLGIICVDEKDKQKMIELGYELHPESDTDGKAPSTFVPKSKHYNKYKITPVR